MRFDPISKVANENKDEEAYDNDKEVEDVEQEDKFYGLLATPHTWYASLIDGGVLHQLILRSRAGGIIVSVMPQVALLLEEQRH